MLDPCDIEDVPEGANLINSMFVYKKKLNADGTLDKYRVRLVARGDDQVAGLDFFETFAHVS